MPVSPTLYDEAEWRRKQAEGSAFVTRIGVQPKIWIVLSPTDGASHGLEKIDRPGGYSLEVAADSPGGRLA